MWETRELYWGLGRGVEGQEGSKQENYTGGQEGEQRDRKGINDFLGSRWVRGRGRKVGLGNCCTNCMVNLLEQVGRGNKIFIIVRVQFKVDKVL